MRLIRPEEISAEDVRNLTYRALSPEELKEVYALARAAFTAADLQRYTELDEGVSAEELLAEMEAVQKEFDERAR